MKPKKIILLVDSNDLRLSIRFFFLNLHGYRVIAVDSGDKAMNTLATLVMRKDAQFPVDLVLAGPLDVEVLHWVGLAYPRMPRLAVTDVVPNKLQDSLLSNEVLAEDCTAAVLLDRVRTLVARRRGPRSLALTAMAAEQREIAARRAVAA